VNSKIKAESLKHQRKDVFAIKNTRLKACPLDSFGGTKNCIRPSAWIYYSCCDKEERCSSIWY